jgi:hypothetical protein
LPARRASGAPFGAAILAGSARRSPPTRRGAGTTTAHSPAAANPTEVDFGFFGRIGDHDGHDPRRQLSSCAAGETASDATQLVIRTVGHVPAGDPLATTAGGGGGRFAGRSASKNRYGRRGERWFCSRKALRSVIGPKRCVETSTGHSGQAGRTPSVDETATVRTCPTPRC